ncbi:MAG: hypothetical protein ACM3QU_14745 [Verrucomicrobiota bacterium]
MSDRILTTHVGALQRPPEAEGALLGEAPAEQLAAERIVRFADRVGRENVIASTDCGIGSRIHPELGRAKLAALADGARLATERLWSDG